ncbi:MAG TPA: histidine kinase dimerization/phospho-acceptor domain-containing protein, partial [Myxococcaceae bacterium]|nr:histidine kinase dimerization/phospho-acceptor domain-containing protein [Myxococcaceae bacterium]
MAFRLTFRLKLIAIIGTTALAFLVLILTSALLSRRVEQQLVLMERVYVPKLELGPRLEGELTAVSRTLQDAVAAHDPEALQQARSHAAVFLREIDAAGDAIAPGKADPLRRAMKDYFTTAEEVSRRLIANETGEALVEAMSSMQAKQRVTAELLRDATQFDRKVLNEVFSSAAQNESTAGRLRLLVTVVCLVAVMLFSLWVGRGVLRSMQSITAGFHRFGRGEFELPIVAASGDELGEIAGRANQMARELRRIDVERRQALESTRNALEELESFSYSVAHDLRAPLRGIDGFSQALLEDYAGKLDEEGKNHLNRVRAGAQRMGQLIDDLLKLSRVNRAEIRPGKVDLSQIAREVADELRAPERERMVDIVIADGLTTDGDPQLLKVAMQNLIGNAWKFTSKRSNARIEFGLA